MKSGLFLVSAVLLCVLSAGCANINMARRGSHSCANCTSKAGCGDMACSGVASSGPAGVSATDPGAVSSTPVDPGMAAGAAPYDPGMYGGYGGGYGGYGHGGLGGHFGHHGRGMPAMEGAMPGPPSAHVAYPYYTSRGPRDFLINNPPSIGY
jgi:hypothetical protein